MAFLNTQYQFGLLSRTLHWVIAAAIIGLIVMGYCLHLIAATDRYFFIQLHKSVGLTVLMLMALRVIATFAQTRPSLDGLPRFEQIAARISHFLLYCLAFVMPLSGWIMSSAFGYNTHWFSLLTLNFPFVKGNYAIGRIGSWLHHHIVWALIFLIALHTLAALKHHYKDNNSILKRMTGSFNDCNDTETT